MSGGVGCVGDDIELVEMLFVAVEAAAAVSGGFGREAAVECTDSGRATVSDEGPFTL